MRMVQPIRPTASRHLVVALPALLLATGVLAADERQTLQERRLGVIKGTTPGIVIWDPGMAKATSASPAASAARSAPASTPASAPVHALPVPAQPGWASRWFGALPPPSGRPLQDARRLDAPDQGIPMPTAASASAAAAAPPRR